ncbi:MAG TPA: hypothetical protein PKD53_18920 [Chloroflexaceae bacterium]|nr:hypothetical protein [Chloroflexaceae bacterium]
MTITLSESILIAMISLVSSVLVAFISAFAAIWSNQKAQKPLECGVIGLAASGGAFGGLLLGVFLAFMVVQITTTTTNSDQSIQPSSTPAHSPQSEATEGTLASSSPVPIRQHQNMSIGTGAFENTTYSDGLAEIDDTTLATQHYRIQRFRREDNPNGCGTARFTSNVIWFSASMNSTILVNGQEIGRLEIPTGSHGYIFQWPLESGDHICAVGYDTGGYQIIFGPDIYYHYDSYCYRGYCTP